MRIGGVSRANGAWFLSVAAALASLLLASSPVRAVEGAVRLHDPSTIVQEDGRFYVYGTPTACPHSSPTTAGRGAALAR